MRISNGQRRQIMKRPWLCQRRTSVNISVDFFFPLKPYEDWRGPAFYVYYITSALIDPVKQLELLDLIPQIASVTLCRQIKIQINLP